MAPTLTTDGLRAVAHELKSYGIEELDAVSVTLTEIASALDKHIVEKVAEAYATGLNAGREAMRSELDAKRPPVVPSGRIVRQGGLRRRV